MNNYFCCCDECGSVDWIDNEIEDDGVNSLNHDGNLMSKKDYDNMIFDYGFPLCANCENKLRLISFKEINSVTRKKIFNMSDEERIRWVKSYWMYKELEKE